NNINARACFPPDSLSIPHESYQPGDFLIGGITSQMWYFFHELSFHKQPSQDLSFQFPIANIFIVYGEILTVMWLSSLMFQSDSFHQENAPMGKLWIVTAQIDFTIMGLVTSWDSELFQGTISFEVPSDEPLGFQTYLQNLKCCSEQGDNFLKDFWEQAFHCTLSNSKESVEHNKICT
ncbi:hypothetical protein E2320_003578, partial [Naja naja]